MIQEKSSKKSKKNHSYVSGNTGVIFLDQDHQALIDSDMLPKILNYFWFARKSHRCWYAVTSVGTPEKMVQLSMHRMISQTPKGLICHHRNRNSLDNHRTNLLNMAKFDHEFLHSNHRLLNKIEPNYRQHPEPGDRKAIKIAPTCLFL